MALFSNPPYLKKIRVDPPNPPNPRSIPDSAFYSGFSSGSVDGSLQEPADAHIAKENQECDLAPYDSGGRHVRGLWHQRRAKAFAGISERTE